MNHISFITLCRKFSEILLLTAVFSVGQAQGVVTILKSKDGREISVTLVSKDEKQVNVVREDGREFSIPYDMLDDTSLRKVENWTSPYKKLFDLLHNREKYDSRLRIYEHGSFGLLRNGKFLEMSKEYGYYSQFGDSGKPTGYISLAAFIFALGDEDYEPECANIIHQYYSSNPCPIGEWMNDVAESWPSNLNKDLLEDFRGLQKSFYDYKVEIEDAAKNRKIKLDENDEVVRGAYRLSDDIKEYSKKIRDALEDYSELAKTNVERK